MIKSKTYLQVVILFVTAMLGTLVPENCHDAFGDWYCFKHIYSDGFPHSQPTWHWGLRHWLWGAMCMTLFIFSVVNIIHQADKKES